MKFRFESILKLHKNQENLIKKELGDINLHLQKQRDRLQLMKNALHNSRKELHARSQKGVTLQSLLLYENFAAGVRIQEKRQQSILSEVESKLEEKRQALTAAMIKRRTMEILREREFIALQKQQVKSDRDFFDEAAANQWRQNQ